MDTQASSPAVTGARAGVSRLVVFLLVALIALTVLAYDRLRSQPARNPVTYRIGAVDPRFGLSREEVAGAVREAVAVWRIPVARELFREEPEGTLVINLVYDQRQEALDKLGKLSRGLTEARLPILALKQRHEMLKAGFERQREGLSAGYAAYQQRVAAFNADNENLRRRGEVTENEARRLAGERDGLAAELAELKRRDAEVEESRLQLNAAAAEVNQLVQGHSALAATYNAAGAPVTREFDEGEYVRAGTRQSITIYAFADGKVLVRVLAHELGHALGLGHGQDPGAIMYPVNLSDSCTPSAEDLAALRAVCRIR